MTPDALDRLAATLGATATRHPDHATACAATLRRLDARCDWCTGSFTAAEWDDRHDGPDGTDTHAECCHDFGPCWEDP